MDNEDSSLDPISAEFRSGNPVIVPTDTIYGLAAPISSPAALKRIFQLKSRPPGMTLPVAVDGIGSVELVARPTSKMMKRLESDLPGPFTFIIPAAPGLSDLIVRNGTVALRIPDHGLLRAICAREGPLGLTSANQHSMPPVMSPAEAEDQFADEDLLMIVEDAPIRDIPSDIIDLTGNEPMLLREGKPFR